MNFTLMICDDIKIYREEIKKYLSMIIKKYPIRPNIVEAKNGKEVLKYLESNSIDVLFMDIEMPELDGIETAKQIRKQNADMLIIFVTAHDSFALQSYDVQGFDYLLKEKLHEFPKKYDRIINTLLPQYHGMEEQRFILLNNKNEIRKVYIESILYFEVDGHRSIAHVTGEKIMHSERISVLEKELEEADFLRCHNSFLVNLKKVAGVVQEEGLSYFELEDQQLIEISRRRKKDALSVFIAFNKKGR